MEQDTETVCVLCGTLITIDNRVVAKDKALLTLIEASHERDDDRWVEWEVLNASKQSIQVHSTCRKNYTRRNSILAAVKNRPADDVPQCASPIKKKLRVSDHVFNFVENCMFCGLDAGEEFEQKQLKYPKDRRVRVVRVESLEFTHSVYNVAKGRNSDVDKQVMQRLSNVIDLVAEEGRYHYPCYIDFRKHASVSDKETGRPNDPKLEKSMEEIFSFMENSSESQFSLHELLQVPSAFIPTSKTLLKKLKEKYRDDIIFAVQKTKETVVCLKRFGHKLINDAWYKSRNENETEERLRIVNKAAEIIREDISCMLFDTSVYDISENNLKNLNAMVPPSLLTFLNEIILKKKKGNNRSFETKCTAIAHAILAATRPRSFLSPLQIGLGTYIHRKFGHKSLQNILHELGFSASYSEIQRFEGSYLVQESPRISDNAFLQFVFDNADFNVNTIDGKNTFHSMGGIACITPSSCVTLPNYVDRLKVLPCAETITRKTAAKPHVFPVKIGSENYLQNFKFCEIKTSGYEDVKPSCADVLWMYARTKTDFDIRGWHGFMELLAKDLSFEKTVILHLPFLNMRPTHYDTIYSSLLTAIDRSKEANQTFSIVTFDQPLYLKAREVIAAMSGEEKFKNVFVRLGGFHLCMSFLGCIGFVMAGSGLKEVLSEIYAPLAVDKMLLGHSYSRAVRGHTIVWLALSKMFMSQIEISNQDAAVLAPLLRTFLESPPKLAEATGLPAVHNLSQKLSAVLIQTEGKGPTSKLWCQYYRMVTLLLQFTAAERSGDWQLHLSTIKDMLPFFHATGHFSYAKSSQIQIYLQDMADLESKLSEGELERFVGEGYFTIRRGDKYWSGTWTDMIIEQNLMRAMKSSGGLTRGRGMSDSVIGKWIGAGPLMLRIVHNLENFCQIEVESGEQHHDLRTSFFKREKSVLNKVEVWFQTNDPFPKTDKCISISTGVIGSEHTNCYNAFDVGCKILESIYQKTFGEIKLSRKNIVRNLEMDTGNTFKVHENDITCDPLRLFQRISIFMTSQDNLEEFFKYELSPYPLSLFDTNGMRKTKKASLYAIFEPKLEKKAPSNSTYILDGGFLLHRAVWPQEAEKFGDILENYISYALRNFGRNCVIIFDGYSRDTPSTKNAERFRRYGKSMVNEIAFHEETKVTLIQEKFLSNDENKTRLIEMLQKKFRDIGIENKIADGDADPLIVQTTLNLSLESTQNCVIIGEDIDLLVILTALCPEGTEIFLLKPGRLNVETKLYSSKSLNARPKLKEHVLFLHAFSGCDTNSAIFGKGKMALCNLIEKNEDIQDFAGHFKDKGSTFNSISESGSKILSRLYGANKKNDSLDKLRFHLFKKNSLSGKKNRLESLPPSEDAAKFHSFRAFHQVQLWLGNQLPPKDWGWRLEGTQLAPVHMSLGPAPEKVLNSIFCGCTKGCGKACGCRKSGLKCTNICLNCCGEACENSRELASFEEEEENVDDVEATIDNDHEDKMQDEEPRRDSNCQEREREKEEDETRMMLRSTTSKRRRLF